MSGFIIHEVTETMNGVVVAHRQWTTCSECKARLNSANDWSEHRRIHTEIDQHTLNCHIPQHILDANK